MRTFLLLLATSFVSSMSFGQMAYVGSTSTNYLYVVDLENQNVTDSIYTGGNTGNGAFTSDFSRFYVPVFNMSSVLEIDPLTHTVIDTIPVGLDPVQVIINQAGTLAYVCNQVSNSVSVIDLSSNSVFFSFSTGAYPTQMALSRDEQLIYVSNSFDFEVGVYSTNTFIEVDTIDLPGTPVGLVLSPDGNELYCSAQMNSVGYFAVIETAGNTVDTNIVVGAHPHDVMVNSTGTKAYVTIMDDNTVSQIDIASHALTTTNVQVYPTYLASNLAETYYYTTNTNSHSLSKIDAVTDAVVNHFQVCPNPICISVFPKNVSLQEVNSADLLVYPNPSNGHFTIELPKSNGSEQLIRLETMDGKEIASYKTSLSIFEWNGDLQNGSYLLSVASENEVSCVKILVNR